MTIKIVVASKNNVFRSSFAATLKNQESFYISKSFKLGKEVLNYLKNNIPDVIIITPSLIDMSGYQLIKQIMNFRAVAVLHAVLSDKKPTKIDFPEALDYAVVDSMELIIEKGKIAFPNILVIRINILAKLNLKRFEAQIKKVNEGTHTPMLVSTSKDRAPNNNLATETNSTESNTRYNTARELHSDKQLKLDLTKVLVIGASTGGPSMIVNIIAKFPAEFVTVFVVQHMPSGFMEAFAERIDKFAKMRVKIAEDGEIIKKAIVYVAPGGKHLEVSQGGLALPKIRITDGPKINYVKPALDLTFHAVANIYGSKAVGVILTGMGTYGKEGAKRIRSSGGKIIALGEEDSVVYGMNKAIIEGGLSDHVVNLEN
ncbi:MAG: hypothetical protein IH840_17580, partial [Candidatus Heimdallarchaeota archaeon]|nr:hypothetical protein [Candidatus Heimdallarchaeota archaeon]